MTRFHQGARVLTSLDIRQAHAVMTKLAKETRELNSDAYMLAKANQHKPWARRWLKQNGYRS